MKVASKQTEERIEELIDIFLPYCEDKSTIKILKEMCQNPGKWKNARELFSAIRNKTIKSDIANNELLQYQYSFEEIVAKTFYNIADLYDGPGSKYLPPFDTDSPFWVYPIAFQYAKKLGLRELNLKDMSVTIKAE